MVEVIAEKWASKLCQLLLILLISMLRSTPASARSDMQDEYLAKKSRILTSVKIDLK